MHWPGYDADEDAEWVFVPDDVHSGDYDLQDYVNAVEDISAIHIQAAVRQSLAQRRTAALHAAAAAKSSSVASRKSFSVATTTYGLRLLVFAFAILIAKRLAPNPLASEGPPKLLYASLTRAIEDGEVRALELAYDPTEAGAWNAIALLSHRELLEPGRVAARVPAHSVVSLLSLVSANSIPFTSPIAAPPSSSAISRALLVSWLVPPSAPPLELAVALRQTPSSNLSSPSASWIPSWLVGPSAIKMHEGLGDLVMCALVGYALICLTTRVGAGLSSMTRTRPRAGRSCARSSSPVLPSPQPQLVRPSPVPSLAPSPVFTSPTPAAALPRKNINDSSAADLKTVHQIGPVLSDRILKKRDRTGPFWEHTFEAQLRSIQGMGDLRIANITAAFYAPPMTEPTRRRAAVAATAAAPRVPPTSRRLEREFEAAARSSTTTTSPVSATTPTVVDGLTWNELQRRTGGYGFTKEQISLMWSAHKKGPLTRDGFRAHCEGRSLSRKTESAMWLQHKLFTATGVRVVPRRRA